MKKIILIFPKTGYDFATIQAPPHGLLTMAAHLLKAGFDVKILDQRVNKNFKKNLKKALNESLFVGISSMTGLQLKFAINISKYIKKSYPKTSIVWGGIHATILPDVTIKEKFVDFIIKGEGEETILELAKAINNKLGFKNINGLLYKENSEIKRNNAREFIDLNRIPKTPWELVDVEKYVFKHEKEEKTIRELDIGQTSRGCPGSCYFCYNMIVHKSKWRGIKPKKVLEQIKTVVKKYRLDAIIFRDDDFFADLKRVEEICKLLIKEKLNIKWYASGIRINQFNQMSDKLITILKESGCTSFRFGVESGSPRILKLINKNINPEDVIKANNKCKKFRIAPHYSFIVGFPTETKKDFLMTVELIDKLKRDNSKAIIHGVNIFTPFPGTVLFKICKKEGLKEPIKIGEWVKFHHLKFLTPKMSKKEKQIVKSIHNLSYFTSQITYDNLPKTLRIISYPLKKWAEYRWKKRWFEFTPEIKIINMLRKIIFKF